jgi:hypothetical protein
MTLAKLRHLWYGAFMNQRWTIGTAKAELGTDASWIRGGRLLKPLPHGDFLADPFVVPGTSGRVLLCEWLQTRRGRGVIARVQLQENGEIGEIHKLIEWAPYHLSYPHVFQHEGKIYCCPESCHARSVRLYELTADVREVVRFEVLIDGFACVDPTVFEHENRWWLLCTNARNGGSNSHLHAFHGPSLKGPWIPHAANPIVVDNARARPAGQVFRSGGRLFRPAQDCSVRYGGGLRLMSIERLTPTEYQETAVWSIHPPVGDHGKHGVHTVNAADGVIAYDAYTERFSAFAWFYRLLERRATRLG